MSPTERERDAMQEGPDPEVTEARLEAAMELAAKTRRLLERSAPPVSGEGAPPEPAPDPWPEFEPVAPAPASSGPAAAANFVWVDPTWWGCAYCALEVIGPDAAALGSLHFKALHEADALSGKIKPITRAPRNPPPQVPVSPAVPLDALREAIRAVAFRAALQSASMHASAVDTEKASRAVDMAMPECEAALSSVESEVARLTAQRDELRAEAKDDHRQLVGMTEDRDRFEKLYRGAQEQVERLLSRRGDSK